MDNLIVALIAFVVVFLFYLGLIILRKDKINKYKNSSEIKFLVSKYKLDLKKINLKKLTLLLGFVNAFIISLTVFVTEFVNNFILKLMVGFIVLFPAILISYHIIGVILNKRSGKNV